MSHAGFEPIVRSGDGAALADWRIAHGPELRGVSHV